MSELRSQVVRLLESGVPENEIAAFIKEFNTGETSPAPWLSWGDALTQSVENTPASAKRYASDMWDAVTNPIDTALGMGSAALGFNERALRQRDDQIREAQAKFKPEYQTGIRPEAQKGPHEPVSDAMIGHFDNRYGSLENLKRTVATDPVGILGDASTLLTGAGGAVRAGGAAGQAANILLKSGKYVDPAYIAGRSVGALLESAGIPKAVGRMKRNLSHEMYMKALKPGGQGMTPTKANAIVRTALDEGLITTDKGYKKLEHFKGRLGERVQSLVDERTALETSGAVPRNIDVDLAAQRALDHVGAKAARSVDPIGNMREVEDAVGAFREGHAPNGPLTTSEAHEIKKQIQADSRKDYDKYSGYQKETHKSLGREMRMAVEANVPETAPLNQRIQRLHELQDPLAAAAKRNANRNYVSLPWAATFGGLGGGLSFLSSPTSAALGGMGSALAAGLGTALTHPNTQARIAVGLHNMNGAGVGGLLQQARVPAQMGRTFQATDAPTPSYGGLLGLIQ